MSERWDAAVAVAGDGPPADLPAAVAEELIALWSDLSQALRREAGQRRSMECDGLVVRIVLLTRLTTATPWQQVPASLLADGIYQGILRSAGVAFAPPVTAGTDQASPVPPAGMTELITSGCDERVDAVAGQPEPQYKAHDDDYAVPVSIQPGPQRR